MDSEGLKRKSIVGLFWSVLDKGGQQLIVLLSGIWLAKILMPEDYGLIGMISIFTYLGNALQESGFSAAIIRKERLINDDLNVAFYMNITIGVTLYLILFFASPLIASFFDEPALEWLSRVVFMMFLFNSFSVVQNAQLVREMRFKTATIINSTSLIISYISALYFAHRGAGAYAVACQTVAFAFCRMVLLWCCSKWRPTMTFKRQSFSELFSFSSKMLLTNILNTCACRLFPSVIGKYYNKIVAGLYENGQRWGNMPQDFVSGTIASVTFPAISAVQRSDAERMRRVCRKMVRVTAFLVFPLFMAIIVCCSKSAISYILKPEWADAVPYIVFISVAGIFNGLNTSNYNVLKTKGLSADILKFEVIRNLLTIIVIVACIPLGIFYMMSAMVAVSLLNYALFSYKVNRVLDISIFDHLRDIVPYFLIMLVAAVVAYFVGVWLYGVNPIVVIICQVMTMAIIYLGAGALFGSKIISESYNILKRRGK